MHKLDIDATIEEIRKVMITAAATPGQDEAEFAANNDGLEAMLAFIRFTMVIKYKLAAEDYLAACGMVAGSMMISALQAIPKDVHDQAVPILLNTMAGMVNRFLADHRIEGDAFVDPVYRDGDA